MKKLYILFTILILTSCYKDYDNTIEEVVEELPKTSITTGINGKLVLTPDADYTQYQLEINGDLISLSREHFFLYLSGLKKEGQLIKLLHQNQLAGMALAYLIENDINYLEITEFPEAQIQDMDFGESQNLQLGQTISINLSDQVFKEGSSILHSGNGRLRTHFINEKRHLNAMPELIRNSEGELEYLSEKEFAVTLDFTTQDGEQLVLDPRQNSLTINNDVAGYDLFKVLNNGDLKKQTLLSDKTYSIDGSGVYIYGKSESARIVEGQLTHNDIGVSYTRLVSDTETAYSTQSGNWIMPIETGAIKDLSIQDACGVELELYTVDEAVFQNKETIELDYSNKLIPLNLSVLDCNGNPVDYPATHLKYTNAVEQIAIYREEIAESYIVSCDGTVEISGVDVNDFSKGPSISWSSSIEDDIKYLSICNALQEGFAYFEINGNSKLYPGFEINSESGLTSVRDEEGKFRIKFKGDMAAKYSTDAVNLFINDADFGDVGYSISCENSPLGCGIDYFNVTHFDENGWLRINLSGRIWAQTIDPPVAGYYPISGVIMTKQ